MSGTIAVPYFDGAHIQVDTDGPGDDVPPPCRAAWDAFLALTPEHRLADSRHVYAQYQEFHHAVGGEDWLDAAMGVPESAEAIWVHVHPMMVWASADPDGEDWFIEIEADCDWLDGHSLQLVWENGKALSKVGLYDGSPRNWFETPDDDTARIVYHATDPRFMTRR
jgi:hypothetical protein